MNAMHSYIYLFYLKILKKKHRQEIKDSIQTLAISPKLIGFLANEDPSARKYAEWTQKTCQDTGILFELKVLKRVDLEDAIIQANTDSSIHGIMIYYPVFGGSQDQYLQNTVSIQKDVEGLCHTYRYNMYHNIRYLDTESKKKKCIIPCTPLAIVKVKKNYNFFISIYLI